MNLEAHYQTLFTGLIVIGAVLLDMYRNRKAAEVKIDTPADLYKAAMLKKIAGLRAEAAAGKQVDKEIASTQAELSQTFTRMKKEERTELARIRAEERKADREFAEMLRHKELPRQKE
jgi:ribose transport system permease protein